MVSVKICTAHINTRLRPRPRPRPIRKLQTLEKNYLQVNDVEIFDTKRKMNQLSVSVHSFYSFLKCSDILSHQCFAKLIYDYVKLDATYPCFSLKKFSFIFSFKSINVIFHGESVAGSGTELYPVCRLRTNLQSSSYM